MTEPLDLKTIPEDAFVVAEYKSNHTVEFFRAPGDLAGTFDFGVSPATFVGDVDESARLFVDTTLKYWFARVDAENARLREALERYGEHHFSCSVEASVSASHPECDCGLRAALGVKP